LILVGASGFSYEEAAKICDCAVGTMKSRVNRARSQLAKELHVKDLSTFLDEPRAQGPLKGAISAIRG
jgi:RNA polymerase sigma-70 factor (ECF subfamily)